MLGKTEGRGPRRRSKPNTDNRASTRRYPRASCSAGEVRRSGCSAGVALFRSRSALLPVLASARRPSLGQTEEQSLVREEQRLLSTQYDAANPCRRPPSSRRFSLSAVSFLVRSGVSPSAVARSVQVAVLGQKLAASALQAGRGGVPNRRIRITVGT